MKKFFQLLLLGSFLTVSSFVMPTQKEVDDLVNPNGEMVWGACFYLPKSADKIDYSDRKTIEKFKSDLNKQQSDIQKALKISDEQMKKRPIDNPCVSFHQPVKYYLNSSNEIDLNIVKDIKQRLENLQKYKPNIFLYAVRVNDIKNAKKLIEKNNNFINLETPIEQEPPYFTASYLNYSEMTKMLVGYANKIKPNKNELWTTFLLAIEHNDKELIKTLIDTGIDPYDRQPTSAFYFVNNIDTLKLLMQYKQKENKKDLGFILDNIIRSKAGDREMVAYIISLGISKEELNKAFLASANTKRTEIINLLIQSGADVNAKDEKNGQTALFEVLNNPEAVKILISKGLDVNAKNNKGVTPLHYAVTKNVQTVKILIEKGAKIDVKDKDGLTPLQWACREKRTNIEIIKMLLAKGANANAKANSEYKFLNVPLNGAIYNNRFDIAKLLIQYKADVNIKEDNPTKGNTPLHYAAKSNYNIVEYLINKGADVNAKNSEGKTPLDTISKWQYKESLKIKELLIQKGAKQDI